MIDDEPGKSFLQGKDLSSEENIRRPACSKVYPKKDKIEFMNVDIDYYIEKRVHFDRKNVRLEEVEEPVIRIFGVNSDGNSVCAHIHHYTPYFHV